MLDFGTIFFDSQPLLASSWPAISGRLINVVDYLKQAENKSGAFVSKDGIFAEGEKALQSLAASEGINITLFKTLDDLYAELERELQAVIREQVNRDVNRKLEEWKHDQQIA